MDGDRDTPGQAAGDLSGRGKTAFIRVRLAWRTHSLQDFPMNAQKMLSTGWSTLRDAGEAAMDYPIAKQFPRVKEWATTGAGLAIAKKGGSVALGAVRRHPVLAIVGAVALAGLGAAVIAKRRREELAASNGNGEAKPRRLKATDMRGGKKTRTRSAQRSSNAE